MKKDDDVLSRLHIVVNLDLPAIYDTLEAISSQVSTIASINR